MYTFYCSETFSFRAQETLTSHLFNLFVLDESIHTYIQSIYMNLLFIGILETFNQKKILYLKQHIKSQNVFQKIYPLLWSTCKIL